jgi:hypothetical protein
LRLGFSGRFPTALWSLSDQVVNASIIENILLCRPVRQSILIAGCLLDLLRKLPGLSRGAPANLIAAMVARAFETSRRRRF